MPGKTSMTGRRRAAAGIAAAATGLAVLPLLGAGVSTASSHREAPLIAGDPQADNTDVYAFVSPDDPNSVTLIANWAPLSEPDGGPNFYPFADGVAHDIEIDNDGDAVADIIYRWVFSSTYRNPKTFLYNTGVVTSVQDPDLNFIQTYDLQESVDGGAFTTILNDQPVAPSYVGQASMPDYAPLRAGAVVAYPGGGQTYAGQADDPFFLDLRVFDLLYGGNFSEVGEDTLDGYNVNTIALKVPRSELALNGDATRNPVIGVISTTSRPATTVFGATGSRTAPAASGEYRQVSRLGMPLVNEVVVPIGSKDLFNASRPSGDGAFLPLVTDPELPKLIEAIYKIQAPPTPRNDLVAVFLTGVQGLNQFQLNMDAVPANIKPSEMLRLNTAIPPSATPNRLGALAKDNAGFPNGRRLAGDVVDIALQVVEGALLMPAADRAAVIATLQDGANANDKAFTRTFPYVSLPHTGPVNRS